MAPVNEVDEAITWLTGKLQAQYINFLHPEMIHSLQNSHPCRYLFATGTYACGVWQHGDDVRLVCMTDNTLQIFTRLVLEILDIEVTVTPPCGSVMDLSSHTISRTANGRDSRFWTLSRSSHAGCRVYLHYCTFPEFNFAQMKTEPMPEYSTRRGTSPNLAMVLDYQIFGFENEFSASIRQRLPSIYIRLRAWAEANGIFGSEFGFAGEEALIWLVYASLQSFQSSSPGQSSDEEIILDAITLLAALDTQDAGHGIETPSGRRVDQIAPQANPTIVEIAAAVDEIDTALLMTAQQCFKAFSEKYDRFLEFNVETWKRQDDLIDGLPARIRAQCANLAGVARIWPRVFTAGHDLVTCFAGIRSGPSASELRHIYDNTHESLLGTGKTDGALATVSVVKSADLAPYLDPGYWGATSDASERQTHSPMTNGEIDSLHEAQKFHHPSNRPNVPSRFRDAQSAINRLRHDPAHTDVVYEVGYLDRFTGLMWMDLQDWGRRATEEEDFIPGHRVRQLRRRRDGIVLWDRDQRIDRTGV